MKKILFLIHDLGQGGAEKVLVNLVNNMDRTKFDISVTVLFGGGVNEQFLASDIKFCAVFPRMIPGNTKLMKLLTPKQLHNMCVREKYDIEVSYLEGPSARIISGCQNKNTKLVSWIHVEQHNMENLAYAFRSAEEARSCYKRFDKTICVSKNVKDDFCKILDFEKECEVLYNTVESEVILAKSKESVYSQNKDGVRLIAMGSLKKSKGYERLLRIVQRLKKENYNIHLDILGIGPLEQKMKEYIQQNDLNETVKMLGYDINPYKYLASSDLFVCASFAEGFSTATTEALIVGIPVCTVEVSGMKELLGDNNEYGIVTENDEEALYKGIKMLLDNPDLLKDYAIKAKKRGNRFSRVETVKAIEELFLRM